MKTRMKRFISLLCVVTLLASTVLSTDFLSAKVEASGGQEKESLPTDMTEISFRNFDIADMENYQGWAGKEYTGETLNNTLFSGIVIFPKVAGAYITYAGGALQEGLNFTVAQDANTQEWYLRLFHSNKVLLTEQKVTATTAGVELVGVPLELHISMEYVNNDGKEEENDLKLGIWFGDNLYENKYIYINDYVGAGKTGKYLTYNSKKANGGAITLKSADIKLPKGMTEITFEDFGIKDETYANTFSSTYAGETMDNTLFSGKLTFSETGETHFMYGGTKAWGGFILTNVYDATKDEHYLRLYDSNADKAGKKFDDIIIYAGEAGVEKLVGAEFKLNYTLEYIDNDNGGTKNDLKLGVWFNGKLFKHKYIYINNYVDNGHSIGTTMTFWNRNGAAIGLKSCNYQLPNDMKNISFRDFGFIDGDYTQYPNGQYDGETLDNTLFSGKITFPEDTRATMLYGGKVSGGGIEFTVGKKASGEYYLRMRNPKGSESAATFTEIGFTSDIAGVQLIGTELDFNLSVEYVNNDGGETNNDLKLGVWFGGKLYNDQFIYVNNYVDNSHSMGTWMAFSINKETKISIESVGEINWKPLPTGMTEITFRDFGFADGDYTQYPSGQYEGETLDNTLFSGKITFPEVVDAFLQYGGKEAGAGFNLGTAQDAATGEWYLRLFNAKKAENEKNFTEVKFYSGVAQVDALVGEEIELNFTVEFVDHDGGETENDVKLGVWFNGKLYNNNYIYLDNYADATYSMGTFLSFSVPKTTNVAIESVGEINWKPLPTGMTEITFRDFGFIDGDYTQYPNGQYEGETLDNTLFGGKITFPESASAHMMYGGKVAGGGFDIVPAQDATTGEWYLRLFDTNQDKSGKKFNEYKFYSDVAGVTLVGKELELNLSVEYVNHDGGATNNDLKLGVWFGGKLYNNNYIYIDNYVDTGHSMGTWMAFSISKTTKITVKSVGTINWKELPEGLTEITFHDFGFTDGDYTQYPSGEYEGETLDNTLFIGKITFPESASAHLMYGGKVAGGGFDIVPAQDTTTGEWYLRLFDTNQDKSGRKFSEYKFYSNVAGVPLVGTEVALMLSLQYVDNDGDGVKNDVKLGVWFGGKLYNNRYIYLKDFANTGHSMGTWMAFSISKTTKITIKSVGEIKWKALPTGLTEIGFSDFGITSGVYEGSSKVGEYTGESLKNTLFSGIVKWHPEVGETHFIYGGTTSGGGFDLVNVKDKETGEHYLRLFYTTPQENGKKKYTNYYFYSDVAGVTLVGEELDLKISLEYVDNDGGKKDNDVRLGIWFGGRLYNNRYIYINNFGATGHVLKNNIQIWNRNGAAFSVGRQSDWLDWSAFGLNANWKKTLLDTDFNLEYALRGGNPYTGDHMTFSYLTMGVCLAVIVLCGRQLIRRRRNNYDI